MLAQDTADIMPIMQRHQSRCRKLLRVLGMSVGECQLASGLRVYSTSDGLETTTMLAVAHVPHCAASLLAHEEYSGFNTR